MEPGWRLIIRDQRFRPLQVIDASNFAGGAATVWSERLPTSTVALSLEINGDGPQSFFIDLPAADAMPEKADHPYYSTKGAQPDWKDLFS